MLKVYILIVVLGLVGGVVYGGWYYYKDTQARIQTLTENSAKLEQAAELQNNTIAALEADAVFFHQLYRYAFASPLGSLPNTFSIYFSLLGLNDAV